MTRVPRALRRKAEVFNQQSIVGKETQLQLTSHPTGLTFFFFFHWWLLVRVEMCELRHRQQRCGRTSLPAGRDTSQVAATRR